MHTQAHVHVRAQTPAHAHAHVQADTADNTADTHACMHARAHARARTRARMHKAKNTADTADTAKNTADTAKSTGRTPSYRCEPDVGKSQELSVREKMPQTLLLGPAPSVAASTSGRESHHRRNTASSPPCEETQPRAWADRLQGTRQTREQDEKPVRTAGRTEAEPAGPTPGWEERWTRRQETRGSVGRAPDAAPVGKESAPSARNDAVLPDYHLDAHRVGAAVRLPEPVVTGQSIPRTRHELRDGAPHVSGR